MPYSFLVETYATERIKVLSVWSEFCDEDMPVRPHPHSKDTRGHSVHEQMVHQCVGENGAGCDAAPRGREPQDQTRPQTMFGPYKAETPLKNGSSEPSLPRL